MARLRQAFDLVKGLKILLVVALYRNLVGWVSHLDSHEQQISL